MSYFYGRTSGGYSSFSDTEKLNYALKIALQKVQTDTSLSWVSEPNTIIPSEPGVIFKNNIPSWNNISNYYVIDPEYNKATNVTVAQAIDTYTVFSLDQIQNLRTTETYDSNGLLDGLSPTMFARYVYWKNGLTGKETTLSGDLSSVTITGESGTYKNDNEQSTKEPFNGILTLKNDTYDFRRTTTSLFPALLGQFDSPDSITFWNKLNTLYTGIEIIAPAYALEPEKKHPFLKIFIGLPLISTLNNEQNAKAGDPPNFTGAGGADNTRLQYSTDIGDNIGFTHPLLPLTIGNQNNYPFSMAGYKISDDTNAWEAISEATYGPGNILYFQNYSGYLLCYGVKNIITSEQVSVLYPPMISFIKYTGETLGQGIISQGLSVNRPLPAVSNLKDLYLSTDEASLSYFTETTNEEGETLKEWKKISGGGGAGAAINQAGQTMFQIMSEPPRKFLESSDYVLKRKGSVLTIIKWDFNNIRPTSNTELPQMAVQFGTKSQQTIPYVKDIEFDISAAMIEFYANSNSFTMINFYKDFEQDINKEDFSLLELDDFTEPTKINSSPYSYKITVDSDDCYLDSATNGKYKNIAIGNFRYFKTENIDIQIYGSNNASPYTIESEVDNKLLINNSKQLNIKQINGELVTSPAINSEFTQKIIKLQDLFNTTEDIQYLLSYSLIIIEDKLRGYSNYNDTTANNYYVNINYVNPDHNIKRIPYNPQYGLQISDTEITNAFNNKNGSSNVVKGGNGVTQNSLEAENTGFKFARIIMDNEEISQYKTKLVTNLGNIYILNLYPFFEKYIYKAEKIINSLINEKDQVHAFIKLKIKSQINEDDNILIGNLNQATNINEINDLWFNNGNNKYSDLSGTSLFDLLNDNHGCTLGKILEITDSDGNLVKIWGPIITKDWYGLPSNSFNDEDVSVTIGIKNNFKYIDKTVYQINKNCLHINEENINNDDLKSFDNCFLQSNSLALINEKIHMATPQSLMNPIDNKNFIEKGIIYERVGIYYKKSTLESVGTDGKEYKNSGNKYKWIVIKEDLNKKFIKTNLGNFYYLDVTTVLKNYLHNTGPRPTTLEYVLENINNNNKDKVVLFAYFKNNKKSILGNNENGGLVANLMQPFSLNSVKLPKDNETYGNYWYTETDSTTIKDIMDNEEMNDSFYGSRWSNPLKAKNKSQDDNEELLNTWEFGPLVLKETPNIVKNVELFLGININ